MKRFECHGCAGCCHGAIALTREEVLYWFSGEFPLVVTFVVTDVRNVPIEKEKSGYARAMKKFSQDHLAFYARTKDNRKIVVHPQIMTLVPDAQPCPKLDELNRCRIYVRKPAVCTLYPFRIDTPVAWMEKGLERERNRAFEQVAHIPCGGWQDTAPVIFHTRGPQNPDVIPLAQKRAQAASATTRSLKRYFMHLQQNQDVQDKVQLYSAVNDGGGRMVQRNAAEWLAFERDQGLLSVELANNLIEGQRLQLEQAKAALSIPNADTQAMLEGLYDRYSQECTILLGQNGAG